MENQVNTIEPEKSPERIEADMFETRESLTVKVAALENQVMGTVQTAANTLTDTVDAVKSFVSTAPEAVGETVDQVVSAVRERVEKTFDISSHVQSNPWSSVGVSVGLGFLAGYFQFPGKKSTGSSSRDYSEQPPPRSEESFRPPASPKEPGLFDEIIGMLGKKVKEMAETAIAAGTVALNKNIGDAVPNLIDEVTRSFLPTNRETTEQNFDAGKKIYGR
jgi:ElaB/YqjD/DUF883 family membrane-anchored ribosome-binding protein